MNSTRAFPLLAAAAALVAHAPSGGFADIQYDRGNGGFRARRSHGRSTFMPSPKARFKQRRVKSR